MLQPDYIRPVFCFARNDHYDLSNAASLTRECAYVVHVRVVSMFVRYKNKRSVGTIRNESNDIRVLHSGPAVLILSVKFQCPFNLPFFVKQARNLAPHRTHNEVSVSLIFRSRLDFRVQMFRLLIRTLCSTTIPAAVCATIFAKSRDSPLFVRFSHTHTIVGVQGRRRKGARSIITPTLSMRKQSCA